MKATRASLFDTIAREQGQFMTPEWMADALIEEHFDYLVAGDRAVEPSCGKGAFLKAMPDEIEIIGVELDPDLAQIARSQCDRQIITGDFRLVDLPDQLAAERAFGNYERGRFVWVPKNVRSLAKPIPCNGMLGFWQVPEAIEQEVRLQLAA